MPTSILNDVENKGINGKYAVYGTICYINAHCSVNHFFFFFLNFNQGMISKLEKPRWGSPLHYYQNNVATISLIQKNSLYSYKTKITQNARGVENTSSH